MLPDNIRDFISNNDKAVLSTFRRNGAAQLSIVVVGNYGDGAAFTTTEDRAKLLNLRRDSRCSMLVSQDGWWGFIVLEGSARIMSADNTDPEELREAFRDVYRSISGEHPDWDEYDRAMVEDRRAVIVVVPERIYGTAL
ncbi:MAG: PPOX class F420-dependent oxidoreductase [Chloroflexi bacterium]|nr:PPOX class F420-dependent oxidoreductase [Chloroflexota bacterium]